MKQEANGRGGFKSHLSASPPAPPGRRPRGGRSGSFHDVLYFLSAWSGEVQAVRGTRFQCRAASGVSSSEVSRRRTDLD